MLINFLENNPMFKTISKAELEKHIGEKKIYLQKYPKGATVYNANDKCTTLDILLSGSLIVYSLSAKGSATTMFEFKKDSVFGANLLFGDNNNYPLNIYCLTSCVVVHVMKEVVTTCLHDYNFTMEYIRSISQNSQGINRKIAMYTQKTLRENILDYLKQQSLIQNSSTVILPISKKQLADHFGVQRPSLFRELKKLKDENIIDIDNRKIILK